jgi:small-conductance mechanosensitive channel
MSHHATVALIVLAAGLVAILIVDRIMQRSGKRVVAHLPVADQAVFATRYRLLRRVSEAVIILIAVIIVLWSFDSTRSAAQTVLASSAVLGLVVGFAARSTLANFVAGVMIAINQPVRLGDRISVGDAEGTVEDIGLAYTRLRTADNRRVLIPNEELANSRVTNMTIVDPISLAQARLTLPPTADPARVRAILDEQADAVPGRVTDRPGPGSAVADVTAEGTTYTVGVWMPDATQAATAATALRVQCITRLHEEGILAEAADEVAAS